MAKSLSKIKVLKLATLEIACTVATDLTMLFRSIYDPIDKALVAKEINGPVVKKFTFTPDLTAIAKT